MAADDTWCDHVTLHTLLDCFETCIHVISSLLDHHDLTISSEGDVGVYSLYFLLLQLDRTELFDGVHEYLSWANLLVDMHGKRWYMGWSSDSPYCKRLFWNLHTFDQQSVGPPRSYYQFRKWCSSLLSLFPPLTIGQERTFQYPSWISVVG